MKIIEKAKKFVDDHKIGCALGATIITSFIGGYVTGHIITSITDFNYFKESVEKSTIMGTRAGLRAYIDWLRENTPEQYKDILKFMKDNPDKYDVLERVTKDQSIISIGDAIGKEIDYNMK